MSLFGAPLLGNYEDDSFFGMHMRIMRQMNMMTNSLFANPFSMFENAGPLALTGRSNSHNSLMPLGFPPMPPTWDDCESYSSTSFVSISSVNDGRPQVYRASSSTRTGAGGARETQHSVSDSRTGTAKMAIGHHIGDRAHIIERQQNLRTGDREENQDLINVDEEESGEFNREWENKMRRNELPRLTSGQRIRHSPLNVPAITAAPQSRRSRIRPSAPVVSSHRSVRSAPLVLTSSPSSTAVSSRRPYSPPGHYHSRKQRNVKTVSGPPDL